ncbi:hypothetical protein Q4574_01345 [Aliiglaciecola sp. 3_MG-2023]|uniref:hypothetical protein n=1 Tax=Aliiglaciecola sp. 3_MG-2023 TaxID=3062644 RepID=UPI0026E3EF6F|nr:hypothetical protein [Aliiglaciecola sp. 3_MG-2023]MDO6691903.1 hypothetical protein [Aliiglaciecola sp. 3_MG-2023]
MSNQFQYIASLCKNIQSNGKVPSVALIKKASNRPLPLREVIEVLRRWQNEPEQFSEIVEDEAPVQQPTDLTQHVKQLEKRIESLEQQVLHLTRTLKK